MPYRSVETEAAVGVELGTLSVLLSEMWILSMGTLRQWAHTCTSVPVNKLMFGMKILDNKLMFGMKL